MKSPQRGPAVEPRFLVGSQNGMFLNSRCQSILRASQTRTMGHLKGKGDLSQLHYATANELTESLNFLAMAAINTAPASTDRHTALVTIAFSFLRTNSEPHNQREITTSTAFFLLFRFLLFCFAWSGSSP